MKKFLLILAAPLLISQSAKTQESSSVVMPTTQELAKAAVDHIDKATEYKLQWLDYEKNLHAEKYDILKRHFKEEMALIKKLISQLGTDKNVDSYLVNSGVQMNELKKKQHLEWEALENKWHETAQAQAKEQAKQLGLETEEEKEEVEETE